MQRLTVLIYHRVLPRFDPMFPDIPDVARFRQQIALYRRYFNLLPLGDAVEQLSQRRLHGMCACITFDDGYADNAEIALPVLRELEAPATFFVSTGFLDGGCMWNDQIIEAVRTAPDGVADLSGLGLGKYTLRDPGSRREAIDRLLDQLKYVPMIRREDLAVKVEALLGGERRPLMMHEKQVRGLREAGMEIGAHTCNHPILTRIDASEARREIGDSKTKLEAILGEEVRLFAYPNGRPGQDYGSEHVAMVKAAGFRAAVSTASGVAVPEVDPFQVPRLQPWPRTMVRLGIELGMNLCRTRCEVV